jgi:hypothetical protein
MSFSRRVVASEFCQAIPKTSTKIRFQKKTGKRSAERRIVLPISASSAAACRAARRLSALTLAALATGYYPDGSAPEPGFPRRPLTGVSPASPAKGTAVKHAPCGPVLVPVDRGPKAARERIGKKNPRAGTAPRHRCNGMPSGTAPCTKRGDYAVTERGTSCQGKSDTVDRNPRT